MANGVGGPKEAFQVMSEWFHEYQNGSIGEAEWFLMRIVLGWGGCEILLKWW